MSSPLKPSFRETPRKNDYLCREVSRENLFSCNSRPVFQERKQGFGDLLSDPKKGNVFDKPRAEPSLLGLCRGEKTTANSQRISNENLAQFLEILRLGSSAIRQTTEDVLVTILRFNHLH